MKISKNKRIFGTSIPESHIINVDVDVYYYSENVAVNSATDLAKIPDNYDEYFKQSPGFTEFESFLHTAVNILNLKNCTIKKQEWSDRNNSLSYYILFTTPENDNEIYMIFLRLSDHYIDIRDSKIRQKYQKYVERLTKQYVEELNDGDTKIYVETQQIVVGSRQAPTYSRAGKYLNNIIDEYIEQ